MASTLCMRNVWRSNTRPIKNHPGNPRVLMQLGAAFAVRAVPQGMLPMLLPGRRTLGGD